MKNVKISTFLPTSLYFECPQYLPTVKQTQNSFLDFCRTTFVVNIFPQKNRLMSLRVHNYIFIIPKFQKTQQREYEVINQEIGI